MSNNITKIITRLQNLKKIIFTDPDTRTFKKYIRENFQTSSTNKSHRKILVEAKQAPSNQLSLSIFLPVFSEFTKSEIISYSMMKSNRLTSAKETIRNRLSILYLAGAKKHLVISGNKQKRNGIDKLFDSINKPSELEIFALEDIKIGDLIYDTYLRQSKRPTIDFSDPLYRSIFMECVEYFYKFKRLFEKYEITGVCVSHTVYHFAIPLRIAISQNIRAYQVTGEAIYSLNMENTHAYTEFKYFKEKFAKFPNQVRKMATKKAQERLELRLNGEVGIDMPYSTVSAFKKDFSPESKPNSRDIKILVATHDFFDSPHSYGDNLFPDFYIWLEALGDISSQTEYKWFIKSHRDSIADDSEILKKLCDRYPKFTLLDSETSHQEIVASGVKFVLTVFGTVAMEYPLLGAIAINASNNNPHINYSFSLTPSNKSEYRETLLNLKNLKNETALNEVFEYYAMAHILNCKSWIYYDYDKYLAKIGGYQNSISPKCLRFFIDETADRRTVDELQEAIRVFYRSGDYKLNFEHFTRPSE